MADFRVMTAKECADRITEIKNPVILMHRRPDGDAVGTACALAEIFRQLGQCAEIISDDPIPERLKFIPEHLGVSFASSLDDREAVAVDVASPFQLGGLSGVTDRIRLMIDHHAVGEPFADNFIKPEASSAAEVLYHIANELILDRKISLTEPLAYALYAAISSDTGRFCYSNATPKTYRTAATLLEAGIDSADINHKLFNTKSRAQIAAEGYVASNIRTTENGRIAYIVITKSDRDRLFISFEEFDTAIDIVRALMGVEVALTVKETDSGELKASLRSTSKNVAEVAKTFGGGGHIKAAGCSVKAENAEKAAELILTEITKKCF